MKTTNSIFLKSLIAGTGFSIAILITGIVYATISHVTIGDKLESTTFNNIIDSTVPTGAVMSFNLATCPTGWSEYTPARGRFIRGIDSTGTNDSVRVAGNLQTDAFQGHFHNGFFSDGGAGTRFADSGGNNKGTRAKTYNDFAENSLYWGAGSPTSDNVSGTPRIAPETRPKNVALLFCEKN